MKAWSVLKIDGARRVEKSQIRNLRMWKNQLTEITKSPSVTITKKYEV